SSFLLGGATGRGYAYVTVTYYSVGYARRWSRFHQDVGHKTLAGFAVVSLFENSGGLAVGGPGRCGPPGFAGHGGRPRQGAGAPRVRSGARAPFRGRLVRQDEGLWSPLRRFESFPRSEAADAARRLLLVGLRPTSPWPAVLARGDDPPEPPDAALAAGGSAGRA